MGVIIVTILVLIFHESIPVNVAMFLIFGSLAWMYIAAALYFKFGFLKFFYHGLLSWHTPDDSAGWFDGCSEHAKCKYCGRDIIQDSQGNWFCF